MTLLSYLDRVMARENLSAADAEQAMLAILGGDASTAQIAAFLVALRMKGETAQELVGFARAMRQRASRIETGLEVAKLVDTCGTGGDYAGTFNISTIAAFVVAGAGVHVAKHGNRSITSRCGSADVMEALGVKIALTTEQLARSARETGIAFLFAPTIHPAMKYAQPARLELKTRTVFNILGPLTNPAGAGAQLLGAPSEQAAGLIAEALCGLGINHGFVVHGSDGLDEITTTGPSLVFEITGTRVERKTVDPDDFGVPLAKPEDLKGGDLDTNCAIARDVLSGGTGPKRDAVLVNAAAALVAAGGAADFREGMALAAKSIDSGAAQRKVEKLVRFTQQFA